MATKRRKVPGEIREVLAQNVSRLMDARYKESSNRPMALAKDAGCSLSSVQRIVSRESGASIDTVEALADVFRIPPFQLLVPWGLLGELAAGDRQTPASRGPLSKGTVNVVRPRTDRSARVVVRRRA